jgi:hypothetical protein
MAPKRSEKDGKKKEAQPASGEWTHSKCSLNDLQKLISEGLLQDKNLVNWRPSFHESIPMENVDEIVTFYHFAERGLALPSCSFFCGLFTITGLNSITSTQIPFATLPSLFTFGKHFSELNPTGIFSASFFESNHNPPPKIHLLYGASAYNLDNKPVISTFHTNSPPTFPGGKSLVLHRKSYPQTPRKVK